MLILLPHCLSRLRLSYHLQRQYRDTLFPRPPASTMHHTAFGSAILENPAFGLLTGSPRSSHHGQRLKGWQEEVFGLVEGDGTGRQLGSHLGPQSF